MQPEIVLVAMLLELFEIEDIGPAGTVTYHDVGDPIAPRVLYRRTSTSYERDLQGNAMVQCVSFDVSVESKFFSDTVDTEMPDNGFDDSGWCFELTNVEYDQVDYRVIFSYLFSIPASISV